MRWRSVAGVWLAGCVGCAVGAALTAEPVRTIDVYVHPYYDSAAGAAAKRRVVVAGAYDALLASDEAADVARARDGIALDNELVTPMTLMVLAIRLYDVGLRDDAVFWFYVAKDRYATLAEVAEVEAPALAQVADAVRNFAVLAGPHINGYAFCDVAKQQATRARALRWVARNPYKALWLPQIPARPGDRVENLERALAKLRAGAADEARQLADAQVRERLQQARALNEADARYCWK
jgi:hypothetical protein